MIRAPAVVQEKKALARRSFNNHNCSGTASQATPQVRKRNQRHGGVPVRTVTRTREKCEMVVPLRAILAMCYMQSMSALDSDAGMLVLNYPYPQETIMKTFQVSFAAIVSELPAEYPIYATSAVILWDDQITHTLPLDGCSIDCDLTSLIEPRGEFGPHVLTIMLIHEGQQSGISDTLDQVQIEVIYRSPTKDFSSPSGSAPESPSIPLIPRTNSIVVVSPRNLSSFLDPNNVSFAFEWLQSAEEADGELEARLELSGLGIVATSTSNPSACHRGLSGRPESNRGMAAGGRCTFVLRSVPPAEYSARISLVRQEKAMVAMAELQFHVWPDHSWVTATTAHGAGLTLARAGEPSFFTIQARDWRGEPAAGAWFVTRLVGPSIMVPDVVDLGGGAYRVNYTAVRPAQPLPALPACAASVLSPT